MDTQQGIQTFIQSQRREREVKLKSAFPLSSSAAQVSYLRLPSFPSRFALWSNLSLLSFVFLSSPFHVSDRHTVTPAAAVPLPSLALSPIFSFLFLPFSPSNVSPIFPSFSCRLFFPYF